MRKNSPIFSHQRENVAELSRYFQEVIVLTGQPGETLSHGNISIRSYNWKPGHKIKSVSRFIWIYWKTIVEFRPNVIFSHMTEVQSALVAPMTKLFKIHHYLWYAHAHNSIYLRWCHIWCDGIITSTKNSCPIVSEKVHYVGQSIDLTKFKRRVLNYSSSQNFVHVGRLDISKNIEMIVESFLTSTKDTSSSLTFIGESTTKLDEEYSLALKQKYLQEFAKRDVVFFGPISRDLLPDKLAEFDCFIHAFKGSLDKSVLEATSVGLPVITINSGFIQEFSAWGKSTQNPILIEEISAYISASPDTRAKLMNKRIERVKSHHSITTWGAQVSRVLLRHTLI